MAPGRGGNVRPQPLCPARLFLGVSRVMSRCPSQTHPCSLLLRSLPGVVPAPAAHGVEIPRPGKILSSPQAGDATAAAREKGGGGHGPLLISAPLCHLGQAALTVTHAEFSSASSSTSLSTGLPSRPGLRWRAASPSTVLAPGIVRTGRLAAVTAARAPEHTEGHSLCILCRLAAGWGGGGGKGQEGVSAHPSHPGHQARQAKLTQHAPPGFRRPAASRCDSNLL